MTEMSESVQTLAEELREIRGSLDQHNRIIRRNRLFTWGLTGVFALVTALGVITYADDQRDDAYACRMDNENSVRDSEVLIGVVLQGEVTPELEETVRRYRADVQTNLRDC